ncbi:MAG: universal stress protein [Hyphomicrobiaceae bacterium]
MKKRRSFEPGHHRKFLIVVDGSQESEAALYYAAARIRHSSGSIVLLYLIEPQDFQHWVGVRDVHIEEETNKAKAMFRLFRRKLKREGSEDVAVEEVIREGTRAEEIVAHVDEDEDVAILVLGAAADAKGPGPLVSALASGSTAGQYPIPITIVPGNLTVEEIEALA